MKHAKQFLVFVLMLTTVGCTPIERQAYDLITGAKGFLDSARAAHPDCATGSTSTICQDINRAVHAKDLLIDATEVYCAGPQFETGGACQPPTKGTAAYDQAQAKLKAAIALYSQTKTDLQGAL